MSERQDTETHPHAHGAPLVFGDARPRGRLRIIGADGTPYDAASPAARGLWRFAEEGFWRYHPATGDLDVTPTLQPLVAPHASASDEPNWTLVVHPDDVAMVRSQMRNLATRGMDVKVECRVRDANGAYRWMRIRAAAEDNDDEVTYAGSAVDITDRRHSEKTFEQMVRQHALILDAAGEGICQLDSRGCITFVNPAGARFLRADVPDLLGRPLCRHLDGCRYDGRSTDTHAPDCALMGTRARGQTEVRQSGRFRRIDDTAFDAEFVVSSIETGDSGRGTVVVFNDVTEKKAHERAIKETRQQMAQAEKLAALGTLVSGVGHELRTPMSYINNHLFLIQKAAERIVAEDPDMEQVGRELVRRCETSMKGIMRMSTLLDDLRETYRPDDAEFRMLDVRAVVEKAEHLFRGAYDGPVHLETRLEDTGEMPIQSGRLQQVVINLLNNAAEAMAEGGTIRLSTCRRGERVLIEVHDEGPGMTQEIQRSIFNPFYTTKKSGSGLGLYLVKQIVDRHMGVVECDTEPGRGTVFRIELRPEVGQTAPDERSVEEIRDQVQRSTRT